MKISPAVLQLLHADEWTARLMDNQIGAVLQFQLRLRSGILAASVILTPVTTTVLSSSRGVCLTVK